jgi:Domain of unknown function (DUF397)
MPATVTSLTRWSKSSRCAQNGTCVELSRLSSRHVAVRDGAHPDPGGPVLVFEPAAWRRFVDAVKAGDLGRN